MPLSKQHKQQTHERILRTAARAFRASGVDGVSIPDLMRQAGLTHGGFYAHFASKDALVAEACAQGIQDSGEQLFAAAEQAPTGEQARTIVNWYLSRSHRDTPETGCVIAALAGDITREPVEVRHAFTEALQRYVARLAALLPEEPGADTTEREDAALVLLSGMAGALLLARAVDEPALSDRILRAARHYYRATFGAANVSASQDTEQESEPRTETGETNEA
jgi:TetR/AcrR family transcriptional repressor of nem operon